jgi:hypothetical protein
VIFKIGRDRMKQKIIELGSELMLITEGYSIMVGDLDSDLENKLITVVEKYCQLLKSTNDCTKVYLKTD